MEMALIGQDSKLLEIMLVLYLFNYIGNISSLISSTTTQIGLYFTGDAWLDDQMANMKTKNNMISDSNKNAQIVSPNPTKT